MTETKKSKETRSQEVFIVDGNRTPYLKARGKPNPFSAADLAVDAAKELLMRQPFAPTDIGEVVMGCIMPREDEANIARIIALRLGCGDKVPAWTVQRNCGSGMQAIDCAVQDIATGRYEIVLAGGTESMSHAPLMANDAMTNWLADLQMSRNFSARLKVLLKFRPHMLKPIIALLHGLSDPIVGLNMGQTAEILADEFNITRQQMDAFALRSHKRLAAAQSNGYLANEISPIYSSQGHVYEFDDGVRADTSMESLAKLKPIFDKKFGLVTAGNSSQITDGACMLILASGAAVKHYGLKVLGKVVDTQWAALDPAKMGLGPVYAATPILERQKMTLDNIDYWEINEAFAAQVLACLAAWENEDFCKKNLGLSAALGKLNQDHLNIDGGAIALGHPVGSSGARIVLHLLNVLKRTQTKYGIAAACIGGGQGGAMLLESV